MGIKSSVLLKFKKEELRKIKKKEEPTFELDEIIEIIERTYGE